MNIAFDWYGSLSTNSHLRELAREAKRLGCGVFVIAAIPNDVMFGYEDWLAEHGIEFDEVVRIPHPRDDESCVPQAKLYHMERLGCSIIFDDNENNLRAVRDRGLCAVQIVGDEPFEWGGFPSQA